MSTRNEIEEALSVYKEGRIDRRDFLRRVGALGVTAASAGALLASATESQAQTPRSGGTLIEGYDREIFPLDPIRSPWADPGINAVYEPLVARDFDGRIVPYLARTFTSGDREWRFSIPTGGTFHSGAPLTPQSVADAINLMRKDGEAQNPSFYAGVTSVDVEGDQVVVRLSRPKQGLGHLLATEYAFIVNIARRAEVGVGAFGTKEADGTGPFKLAQFQPASRVRVERWDGYKGNSAPFIANKGRAHLDAVQWVPILEPSQRAAEIVTGSVQAVKNPAPADVDRLKSNPDLVVIEFQEISNFFLSPNASKKEIGFDDVRVRQALSHAIDRSAIVKSVLGGRGEATRGPASSGWTYYERRVEQYNAFDPKRSMVLLDEAGWKVGKGGIREKNGKPLAFSAVHIASPIENQVMAAIAAMFEEVGIAMKVESLEPAAMRARRATADMWAQKWLWTVPGDVIPLFVRLFQPKDHPDVVEVLTAADQWDSARTDEELIAAASRMQIAVASRAVLLPIYTPTSVWVHHKKVHGWRPNKHTLYPFYNDVWLEA
jgi:peptide/nickel transport system substrate-binding protein